MKSRKPKHRNRIPRRTPLKRGKPLGRGKGLERSGALKRSGGLTQRPTPFSRMPPAWRRHWMEWKDAVCSVGVCAVCGRGPRGKAEMRVMVRLDPHHIVPARYIRSHMRTLRKEQGLEPDVYEELLLKVLFDPRNGICACADCHEDHEKRVRPIRRALIPAAAFEFAREIGLDYVIDRFYPA